MKIKLCDLKLFFSIFLCMIPVGLFLIPGFKIIWYSALGMMLCGFCIKRYYVYTKFDNWNAAYLFLYLIMHAIATFINNGNWKYNILTLVVIVLITIFCNYEINYNYKCFIYFVDKVLITVITIESILHLTNIGNYFMDFACLRLYYICWAVVNIINHMHNKKNKSLYMVSIFLVLITIIKPDIGSDGKANYEWTFYLIVLILLFTKLSFNKTSIFSKFIGGKKVFTIIVILNLFFTIFQSFINSSFFQYIIVSIMHKSGDISGRSGIWKMALSLYVRSPVWGYGISLAGIENTGDYWIEFMRNSGPHNQILYILLSGGMVTLVFYILMFYKIICRLSRSEKKYSYIICMGILASYIELLVTFRNMINCIPLFILFSLGYYSPKYKEKNHFDNK